MAFEERNKVIHSLGMEVYIHLKSKYPGSIDDCDMILNSLCMALTCLIHEHAIKEDWPTVIKTVEQILTNNC